MKKRFLSILSVFMCAVMLFSACKKKGEEKEQILERPASDENLVAIVEDVDVTQADYGLMYKLAFGETAQYEAYGEGWYNMEIDDDGTTMGDYLKTKAMNSIVDYIAVAKLAEESGIKMDDELIAEVDAQIEVLKEKRGSEEDYKLFLEKCHTDEDAVRKYYERTVLYNKWVQKVTAEGGEAFIDDETVLEAVPEGEDFESIKQQMIQEKVSELIEKKANSLKVEKKDDVINEIVENWMKDLGVDTSAKPSTEGIQ